MSPVRCLIPAILMTASLAILVDEGRLNLDDKVVDHIPDFALYDPWVTKEFTILDLQQVRDE